MRYNLADTDAALESVRADLRAALAAVEPVGFDYETDGPSIQHPRKRKTSKPDSLRHRVIGYGLSCPLRDWYIPVRHRVGGNAPEANALRLLQFLRRPEALVAAHNWPFELQVSRNEGIEPACRKADSQVAAWMRGMRLPKPRGLKLKPLMAHYYNAERPGFDDVRAGRAVPDVPPAELGPYCAADASDAKRLWLGAWAELSEEERLVYWGLEADTIDVVAHMQATGVPIDRAMLLTGADDSRARMVEVAEEFKALTRTVVSVPVKLRRGKRCDGPAHFTGAPTSLACAVPGCVAGILHFKNGKMRTETYIDPTGGREERGADVGSSQQVSRWLVDELEWWPAGALPRTKVGYSTEAEHVKPLIALGGNAGRAAELRLEYQGLTKYADLYTATNVALADQWADRRLHTSYLHTGTETGRFSSSFPNIANIPRDAKWRGAPNVRAAFVAPPGWKWVVFDLSQIELRIVAHYSRDARMLEIYRTGGDIHAMTMERLGIPRPPSKIVNFSTIYRISKRSLAAKISFATGKPYPVDQAGRDIEGFFETYAGVARYHRAAIKFAEERGYVRLLNGFHIPIHGSWQGRKRWATENQVINYPIQGGAGVILKRALAALYKQWRDAGVLGERANIAMQTYDEIGALVRDDYVDQAFVEMKAAMEGAAPELIVPVIAEGGVGLTYAEAKGK